MTQSQESFLLLFSKKEVLVFAFLLCALPLGLFMALLVPPGQVPDEPAHMTRAAGLLHGAVLATRRDAPDPVSGKTVKLAEVRADYSLIKVAFPAETMIQGRPVYTQADQVAVAAEQDGHVLIDSSIPNTATYFPSAYLPAALALAAGRFIHATPYRSFLLARVAMLMAFLSLGVAALRVAAYGGAFLLAVLILPMTVFLAGSLNEDGVLIAMTALAAACLTRGPEALGLRFLGAAMLVLFLMSKPPYILLLGFLLLPLHGKGFLRRTGEAMAASVPVLLWLGLLAAFVIVPFGKPPYHPGPLFGGDASVLLDRTDSAVNLHILLAKPKLFFSLPSHFLHSNGAQALKEMIGILGVLAIQFHDWYYHLWWLALAFALAGVYAASRPAAWSAAEAVLTPFFAAAILAGTCWVVMISMYISWTNIGEDFIDGVQGRYLIPLLPFLILAWPMRPGRAQLWAALPALALGIYDLGFLPLKIVGFFYAY